MKHPLGYRWQWLYTLVVALMAALTTFSAQAAVTAGPGAWSSQQTWAADTINGGNLSGYFYWPASQPTTPNGKRALVLVLHGCLQTASGDVIDNANGAASTGSPSPSNMAPSFSRPMPPATSIATIAGTTPTHRPTARAVMWACCWISSTASSPIRNMRSTRTRSTWPACLPAAA